MALADLKLSNNPELVGTVTDIVGLYLAAPENAVVLCVDEKSRIQALNLANRAVPRTNPTDRSDHAPFDRGPTFIGSLPCKKQGNSAAAAAAAAAQ